jgi:NDP-sugar pyrophosphorylase family protein
MEYKVCILAAGVGSALGELSKKIHHSVLPVNFKAAISHIIERFPPNIEVVIAIGHNKETVKDYLSIAHPNRRITFVEIEKYFGPGAGPGHTLFQCQEYLQSPFVLVTADTIVLEDIPAPYDNWLGIAPVNTPEKYATVKIKNNLIYLIEDKIKTDNKFAYIGLAGIKDYQLFFDALSKEKQIIAGEIQTTKGFKELMQKKKLIPMKFTWFDVGNVEKYVEANNSFIGGNEKYDFSKTDEFLYFVDGKVIKFFADKDIVRKRVERAKNLEGLCPKIEREEGNFYSYQFVEGHDLYNVLNPSLMGNFLRWARTLLWEKKELTEEEKERFRAACKIFYYDKTMKRIQDFYEKNNIVDSANNINGIYVPPLKELLSRVDWETIFEGLPTKFHGDLTIGNILVVKDKESNLDKFVLLDWRHDFGGLREYGDMYYDLAKLYKGVILSDNIIKEGMFSLDLSGSNVYYDYFSKRALIDAEHEFEDFVKEVGLDLKKIKTITAIALLNMSSLHKYPFNFLVYYLGKFLLYRELTKRENAEN